MGVGKSAALETQTLRKVRPPSEADSSTTIHLPPEWAKEKRTEGVEST